MKCLLAATVLLVGCGHPLSARPRTILVEGTVSNASGQPVSGAVVALIGTDDRELVGTSDASGRFHFDVAPGRWAVSAQHAGAVGGFVDGRELTADTRDLDVSLGDRDGVELRGEARGAAIPAGAYVRFETFSDHDGEVWVAPLDRDGSFAALLPRHARYFVEARSGLIGYRLVRATTDHADASFEANRAAPAPAAVTAWLRERGTRLAGTDPGLDLGDLAPVASIVGDARVVGLGEATHGSREFFQLKHRLLRYLVEREGFTLFALEANEPECRAIDAYVHGGPGDPDALLAGTYFWTWQTEEVRALIAWMRAWNADPAHRQVSFVGIDMQTVKVALDHVSTYLRRVDPEGADGLLAALRGAGELDLTFDAPDTSDARRREIAAAVASLEQAFDDHRATFEEATSAAEYATARHDLTVVRQWLDWLLAPDDGTRDDLRDRDMADNLAWELGQRPPGTRAVVWAHNEHVERGRPHAMGRALAARYGRGYRSFGFVFDHGSFRAYSPSDDEVRDFAVGPTSDLDVAIPFARAGAPILVADLRAAPPGVVADYFARPQLVRQIGAVFTTERDMELPAQLSAMYDALIYVAATTPARPL